jgi:predicted Zn-dependent peptidase
MNETEVDGVPVLWAEAPGPLTGTLVFGVGARDETFRTIGVTHLVEHLAMSTLPRVHYEHNAAVDLDKTEFYAAGKPEHVVSFLAAVCEALGDLPLDRIEKEAGVLAAEGGHVAHPTAAVLLNRRFGANGAGLALWEGPGYDRLTAEHVTEHVRKFFTKANAVVTFTGAAAGGADVALARRGAAGTRHAIGHRRRARELGCGAVAGGGARVARAGA